MSSFVLLTRDGPPDLIVEVGNPISKDPVLLTGMFKAIVTVTNELTNAPLQVLQTKGFTIKFKNLDDDYVLIVGTDHTVVALDSVLLQIEEIIHDAMKFNIHEQEIEKSIHAILEKYIERGRTFSDGGDFDVNIKESLEKLPSHMYQIIYFGLLAGFDLGHPRTPSLDYNRDITALLQYLEHPPCSDVNPQCQDVIVIHSKDSKFIVDDVEYTIKDIIRTNKLLTTLVKLSEQGLFDEVASRLHSDISTIIIMQGLMENLALDDLTGLEELNELRYVMGSDIEHYALLRLQKTDPEKVRFLQENTSHAQWITGW